MRLSIDSRFQRFARPVFRSRILFIAILLGLLGPALACGQRNDVETANIATGEFSTWSVLGVIPFDEDPGRWDKAVVSAYGTPDADESQLTIPGLADDVPKVWTPQDAHIVVGFAAEFGWEENGVAYAYCELESAEDQSATIEFGSDDTARIWLNGEQVHNVGRPRALRPGQDRFRVELKRGLNPCLIKVANGMGDWGFSFRIQAQARPSIDGWRSADEWRILGRFPSQRAHDLEEDFLAEHGGESSMTPNREQRFASRDGGERSWRRPGSSFVQSTLRDVELNQLLRYADRGTAYAWSDIDCERPAVYRFHVRADDHVKVWINGRFVHRRRGANLESEPGVFYAKLNPGVNRCLVRVDNEGGRWGFGVRPVGTISKLELALNTWLGPLKRLAERIGVICLGACWFAALVWMLFFRRSKATLQVDSPVASNGGERRYDIDWIRVIAFLFLILFHVAIFIPNKADGFAWNSLSMTFVRHWRMPILFVISGMATRFAMSSHRLRRFVKTRSARLLIPLLFWVFVFCPLLDATIAGIQGREFSLWRHEFISMKTGHLWYVYVLFIYTAIFLPILVYLRERPNSRVLNAVRWLLGLKFGIYVPPFVFFLNLFPYDPFVFFDVNAANHALLFLMGFILVCVKDEFFDALRRIRIPALLIGVASLALFMWLRGGEGHSGNNFILLASPRGSLLNLVGVINMWSWVLVIFGFGEKYLNRPSALLVYASDAVYPFYVFHHMFLDPSEPLMQWSRRWENPWIGFWLVSLAVFFACWIIYESVRRVPVLNVAMACKPSRPAKSSNSRQ